MPWTIHSTTTASEEAKPLLAQIQEAFGFVPNVLAVSAESPLLLKSGLLLSDLFSKSSFSPIEQDVISLSASFENNCQNCMASHSAIAMGNAISPTELEALRSGMPLNDPKLQALRQITQRIVETRGEITQEEVSDFLAHGYTKQQLFEIIVGISMKVIHNFANIISKVPLDEAFQDYQWSRPAHIWTEQQLQLIFDHLPQRTFWKNKNLQYVGCNHNFAEDMGLSAPEDIIGKSGGDLKSPVLATLAQTEEQRILESGQPQLNQETAHVSLDGTRQWFNVSRVPLYDRDNQVIGTFCSYEDISSRKATESALQEANIELQKKTEVLTSTLEKLKQSQLKLVQSEKMSALGGLVAGVAHEINNPVGCVVGNVDATRTYIGDLLKLIDLYAERCPNPDSELTEALEEIDIEYVREDLPKLIRAMKDSGKRIASISKSLRTFSRTDTEAKQAFDLHEGLDSTVLILRHRLKATDWRPAIEVITEYGDIPEVACFPGQLNQVFMNILANAIDALDDASRGISFSELEARPSCITIRTEREDQQVKISISDNGPGMSLAVKAKIFDHLFTTKKAGKGTGLGLAIARQIVVESHNGTLEVQTTAGEGTAFCIRLPLA
ncbi:MAG: ATP-binding protein [Cyanobacteria bacterium P01_D01_bin.105]